MVSRDEFERLSELREFALGLNSERTYFQRDDDKLTNPLKRKFFLDIEQELQVLDFEAWEFLKKEIFPRLTAKDSKRGWQQLFETLNEVKGYIYLKNIGCARVKFIRRSKVNNTQTPDLQGELNSTVVLCEVKTINASAAEIERRQVGGVGTTHQRLEQSFYKKLENTLDVAESQLTSFGNGQEVRRIALIVVNFDDHLHEYADVHQNQINEYMSSSSRPTIEVVFNIKPPFYSAV